MALNKEESGLIGQESGLSILDKLNVLSCLKLPIQVLMWDRKISNRQGTLVWHADKNKHVFTLYNGLKIDFDRLGRKSEQPKNPGPHILVHQGFFHKRALAILEEHFLDNAGIE